MVSADVVDARDTERTALLHQDATEHSLHEPIDGEVFTARDARASNGEDYDDLTHGNRQLGIWSTTFLIFNRLIGTGIFATPSTILRASGSVGFGLVMWLLGAIFAATGTALYVELGTGLPRSGGEKIYLEYFFRRPKFLISCILSAYFVINGGSAANSVVFGEYALHALDIPATPTLIRMTSFCGLTFAFLLHSWRLPWGLKALNGLGAFKLAILTFMALAGLAHLLNVPGFDIRKDVDVPHNFERDHFWEGTRTGVSAFVTGMYTVIWSYIGYQNANYALSEIRNPVRTMKIAGPLAIGLVTILYLLVNVAYLAVVSKADILSSGRMVGALFFRNLYGPSIERFFSFIIACSTLGNVLSTTFAFGRVVQELGREGVLPFSSFFSSNKPWNAPMAGIGTQWFTSAVIMLAAPPGDAYLFLLNLSSYPFAIFNALIPGALLLARFAPNSFAPARDWAPPFRAPLAAVLLYFVGNVLLVVAPLLPPERGFEVYAHLPYWTHAAAGLSISLVGTAYWYGWFVWLPRKGGYKLRRREVMKEDGVPRMVFENITVQ